MSKGRRYNKDSKLNVKKVAAVLIALVVIVMFVIMLVKLVKSNDNRAVKTTPIGYYAIYENGKWGVINGEGKTVIEPTYEEMIAIPDVTKDVFIVTYNVNYEDETYQSKAINSKNQTLFTNYSKVEVISNYNKQNSLFYYDNCLKVEKDGKYGLIDFSGKQLIDCLYDEITPVPYLKNSLITEKDGKKGLISSMGAVLINNEYSDITGLTEAYEDGYIVKNTEEKYGVIGTNKKIVVPVQYESISSAHSGDFYIVKEEGKLKIFNAAEGATIDINASKVKSIDGENIIIENQDKYGLITATGEQKLDAEYQDLSYAFSNYYIAKLNDKYGLIDTEGNTKLEFKYDRLIYRKDADFLEGSNNESTTSDLMDRSLEVKLSGIISSINLTDGYMKIRVNDEYKYYNFKFEEKKNAELLTNNTLFLDKKDGKYGFINKDGIVIVNYIYDDATEQNKYGFSAVKKDGKWGAIDSEGNVVVKPSLELTNNPIIDFIGSWHLAEDTNSNYYTK